MASITVSTLVNAPLAHVFEVFSDLGKAVERIPAVVSLDLLTDGPFGEGTRWRETRLMFKKEATEEMWVTQCDAPNSYTVSAESHGMRYDSDFLFAPEKEGVRVTWSFEGKPLSLSAKIMSPLMNLMMKGIMKKCMKGDMEALRDAAQAPLCAEA